MMMHLCFQLWARHTGKYNEATMEEDYSKWKHTLQMTLNQSKDIKVLEEDQQNTELVPYNYYQFKKPGLICCISFEFH